VDCDGGMMQRPERIVYLGVGAIFSPLLAYLLRPYFSLPLDFLLVLAILLIAVMTNVTALYRMAWIYRKLGTKGTQKEEKKSSNRTFILHQTQTRGRA